MTVDIYAPEGTGRLLVADLDIGKAQAAGAEDPAAVVASEAAALAGLIERCGGHAVHDVSPRGGRHVYLKLARPVPWQQLRRLAEALAVRFPALDPGPMRSPRGQIRVAGAPYKRAPRQSADGALTRSGPLLGYMALAMPLAEAVRALRRPCGPGVWERLHIELAAELAACEPAASTTAPLPGLHLDNGRPWLPRLAGPAPLPARLAELARTGDWSASHLQPPHRAPYPSASEARYAVLAAAAAAGHRLAEVLAQAHPGGGWAGLDRLLGTRTPAQRRAVLRADWDRSVKSTAERRARQSVRNLHTSSSTHTPLAPAGDCARSDFERWSVPRMIAETPVVSVGAHAYLCRWQTAVWLAERDPERLAGWGRQAPSIRVVLRALALASRLTGARADVEFGCRALALMSGLSWRTVACALAVLREEPDPLIDLVRRTVDRDADLYTLRMPDAYRGDSARLVWEAGRIETAHPAWIELGPVCALLYESLAAYEARPIDLERRAVLSSSAVADGLRTLGAYGLAERGLDGWRRGPATLDDVATELDANTQFSERVQRYREHRAEWHAFLGIIRDPTAWPTAADIADQMAVASDVGETVRVTDDAGTDPVLELLMTELGGQVINGDSLLNSDPVPSTAQGP